MTRMKAGLNDFARRASKKIRRMKRELLPQRGGNVLRDIGLHLPNQRMEVIFDVGANLGRSAIEYSRACKQARIYCFEPVRTTFDIMRSKVGERCVAECIALSDVAGSARMDASESPEMAHLTTADDELLEMVAVDTVDAYCSSKGIAGISFMKIDTEGYDLHVLKGANGMLAGQKIDLVQVEAGISPENRRHVPLEAMKTYLEERDYFLFGIYDQVPEWPTGRPHLRRVNAVFISKRASAANIVPR
jgi:FkbM family methyltransferase